MNKITNIIKGAFLAALLTTAVKADDNWVLSLSGGGNTILQGDAGTKLGGGVEIGRSGRALVPLEIGARQNFSYASKDDSAVFDTALYLTLFPINFHRLQVGPGFSFGTSFGDTKPTWSAQPELTARLYLVEKAAIQLRVGWPMDVAGERLGDRLTYVLGMTFKF